MTGTDEIKLDAASAFAKDHRPEPLYGLLAAFRSPEDLLEAARQVRAAGYRRLDAFSPFPVHGLADLLGHFRDPLLPRLVAIGAAVGYFGMLFLQWYGSVVAYPLNVGGRPLAAWPAFQLPAFEMGVLFATFAVMIGMLARNHLPRLSHPVFAAPGFERASADRFFLCILASDPRFDRHDTRAFLEGLETPSPVAVEEVLL